MSDKETNSGLSDKDQAIVNDLKIRAALEIIKMKMPTRSEVVEMNSPTNKWWYDLVNEIKGLLEESVETDHDMTDVEKK